MTAGRFAGGSLKIVASRAPRNLRRHTARVLLVDEADAMDPTPKGGQSCSPSAIPCRSPNRKIVLGSTPLREDTSNVLRSYAASDQRVYEVPCPQCGTFTEILWQHIEWDEGEPATAAFRCPSCRALVAESAKPGMVSAGRWRATRPDVVGHAGFRLNALEHPNGGTLKVDAAIVDSGDRTDQVYNFCFPRLGRRIWAGKGFPGSRPALQVSRSKIRGAGKLFLVGSETIKAQLADRLGRGTGIRFSHTLEAPYFEQLTCERLIIRYVRGQPVRRFERISGRRAEALDCLVYSFAARAGLQISLDERENALATSEPAPAPPWTIRSGFVDAW